METRPLRIVHYLNQFFGGIGGEDKAHVAPQLKTGPVGPGVAAQRALGSRGEVVATIVCGDNYFAEKIEDATAEIINLIRSQQPDAVIAGPAFEAGRYGIACGAVCKAVKDQLGIPAVTGMYKENAGADLFRNHIYIIETENTAKKMFEAISKMVDITCRISANEKLGRPSVEGYLPRGVLENEISDQLGAERVVSMLLAKIQGELFETEVPLPKYDRVSPAPSIQDLRSAKIALVTDGGLVRIGNPEKIETQRATRFASYSINDADALTAGDYEVSHIGYTPVYVTQDPNRLVPVDVVRDLEKEGIIGKLHEEFYSTTGACGIVDNMKKIGEGIAKRLKEEGVTGVILTST